MLLPLVPHSYKKIFISLNITLKASAAIVSGKVGCLNISLIIILIPLGPEFFHDGSKTMGLFFSSYGIQIWLCKCNKN